MLYLVIAILHEPGSVGYIQYYICLEYRLTAEISIEHDGDYSIEHDGDYSIEHDGDYSIEHDGDYSIEHDDDYSIEHDDDYSIEHDGDYSIEHDGDYYFHRLSPCRFGLAIRECSSSLINFVRAIVSFL